MNSSASSLEMAAGRSEQRNGTQLHCDLVGWGLGVLRCLGSLPGYGFLLGKLNLHLDIEMGVSFWVFSKHVWRRNIVHLWKGGLIFVEEQKYFGKKNQNRSRMA